MKKLAFIVLGLIALLVVAVLVAPAFIDWNRFKPQIAEAVRNSTGRDLRIDGDLKISLLPSIRVSAGDVRLSNAAGMTAPDMVSIGSVALEAKLWPLLGKRLVVNSLVVKDASINLEVDKAGHPNWSFAPPAGTAAQPAAGGGSPFSAVQLGEVRIEQGRVSYRNAASGQTIEAKAMSVAAEMADLSQPLTIRGQMTLNDEPVSTNVTVDSLGRLSQSQPATIQLAVDTKHLRVHYDGTAQQSPVPGLGGTFDLDIASVGQFLAWLHMPLDAKQPDPGPLKVHAVLAADGAKVALKDATIIGTALKAHASGSLDASGSVTKASLEVESDVLDVDRYLPPQAAQPARATPPSQAPGGPVTVFAMLSDKPLDLGALRATDADIKVAIAGVKALGYEVGRIAFTTTAKNGVVNADLTELSLYGGDARASAKLDASGDALGLSTSVKIDHVTVDKLAEAATGAATVSGVVSATLDATARGASPRALAESLSAKVALDLGGVSVKQAQAHGISGLKLTVDLPGPDKQTNLKASLVYNAEPVTADVTTGALRALLSGDRFPAKVAVTSKLVSLGYDGTVQRQPVPGLDGVFDLDIPSVGKLASWLDRPLDPKQPDPGPLKVHATLTADGSKLALKDAAITGTALKAHASGSLDTSGSVTKASLELESDVLDVDRYLPPAAPARAEPQTRQPASAATPLTALSDKPLDLGALRGTDADIKVAIAGIKALGYEVGRIAFTTTAKAGVVNADLTELGLYGGTAKGHVKLDAAGNTLGLDTSLKIDHVTVDKLAQTAMGDAGVSGVVSATLDASARGASPRALAESLSAKIALDLGGMSVKQAQAHGISGLKLTVDLPGPDKQTSLKASLVYNGEPLTVDATTGSLRTLLAGDRFPAKLAAASKVVSFGYDGTVQQKPVPGLDGALDIDIPSVGKLASWLDQPLDPKQPDPGPLKVHASLTADGSKLALKDAAVTGKALKATADGRYDASQKVATFDANVDIQQADLNAYLPPQTQEGAAAAPAGGKSQPAGWSTEPFDLAMLQQANGQARVHVAATRYGDIEATQGQLTATLTNRVLKLSVEKLALAQGTITSSLVLDGSSPAAKLDYDVAVTGAQARPLLKIFADTDRLSGTIEYQTTGKGSGRNQKELVESLNGSGRFVIRDGAINGINLASTLRQVGSLGFKGSSEEKTDFAELSGTYSIKNGILDNRDLKMLAPLVRLTGSGTVPMPPRTIDYKLEAKLVATTEGQGGKDALAGLPIPIKITGSWSDPSYQVDWKSVFTEMAKNPEQLKNLPANLGNAAKSYGVNLPGVGAGAGGAGGLPKGIPGLPFGGTAPTAPGAQPPSTSPQSTTPSIPGLPKGLFGQ